MELVRLQRAAGEAVPCAALPRPTVLSQWQSAGAYGVLLILKWEMGTEVWCGGAVLP